MIEEIVSLQMPVEERLVIKKNRLLPSVTDNKEDFHSYRYTWR